MAGGFLLPAGEHKQQVKLTDTAAETSAIDAEASVKAGETREDYETGKRVRHLPVTLDQPM